MRRLGLIRPRDFVPSPPLLEGRPLLAVSGSSWGPVEVSSHVPWTVRGRLPLRGHRGPGPVRASVFLSQVLARSRGHTCRTLRGTGSVSNATSLSVCAWLARNRRIGCNRGCGTCVVGRFRALGVAVQRRPRKYSEVTGALVAGRAVT